MQHHSPPALLLRAAILAAGLCQGSLAEGETFWQATDSAGPQPPARLEACRQLPTAVLAENDAGLPVDLTRGGSPRIRSRELPGHRVPALVPFSALAKAELTGIAVSLREANTLAHLNFAQRRFGRLVTDSGSQVLFNPEVLLVKFKQQSQASALRVPPEQELECARVLVQRPDVAFVEFDTFQRRMYWPNDPLITNQWHHQKIGSYSAWNQGLGQASVRIAIVDTPFQMDHPDLAANTLNGWDAGANLPVTASSGIDHSTLGAGMAAAIIGNDVGVAGAGNCALVPINIDGSISQMYDAVIWAADHGIRVVNISWTGGDSATLNLAGTYLRTNSSGILAMAGGNLPGDVDPTFNQPDIWCISMTDAADLMRSEPGAHIDFAAPGYLVYSTTTNGGYALCTGTSFSTPLFCGVVALLFSINPTLTADEVVAILKRTAADLGQPGWDNYYGWGRIDFAAAAAATAATVPPIRLVTAANNSIRISADFDPSLAYSLWIAPDLTGLTWQPARGALAETNGNQIVFVDGTPGPAAFYRLSATRR